MNVYVPKLIAVLAVLLLAGTAYAGNCDVNVVAPNVPLYLSSNNSPTYDINFLVRSTTHYVIDINANIWLSTGPIAAQDLNHLIVADLNIMKASTGFACVAYQGGVDYNFYDANQMCKYTWTPAVANFPDGNWTVDVNVYAGKRFDIGVPVADGNSDRDWSDSNFRLDNTNPACVISSPSNGVTYSGASFLMTHSATDANSGGILTYYTHKDSDAYASIGTSTTKTWALDSGESLPVSHTYYLKARDWADNNCTAQSILVNFQSAAGGSVGGGTCGDGTCGSGENAGTCPSDCPASCGDGVCTHTESASNCPADCVTGCGNKKCDAGETCSSCASDCGSCAGEETPSGGTPGEGTPSGGTPVEVPSDPCAGINCNDNNPCTTDNCYSGECSSVAVANGTSCGYGKECRSGACAAVSVAKPAESAGGVAGLDMTTLGLIVVVVVVLAGAYFFMVAKK
ncbi:MAG: hypothetical protein V1676_07360 [Candidatus Diapherotrites archaeon]